jgi:prepilin-type N-terminal cleavage/methylation domain-containing protein/prepilin-type processing-associated H-X9-DG protein
MNDDLSKILTIRSVQVFPKARDPRSGGFTLVELLVVIGIIGVLVGILLPVMGKVRESSNRTACRAALRDIGVRYRMYLDDHKQRLPWVEPLPSIPVFNAPSLVTVLEPYSKDGGKSYRCPADRLMNTLGGPSDAESYFDREGLSYRYNFILVRPPFLSKPLAGNTINVLKEELDRERYESIFPPGKLTRLAVLNDFTTFHGKAGKAGAMNYLFWDGRVGDIADEVTSSPGS